jgi:deoxyribodipyrimidine photo-lyase
MNELNALEGDQRVTLRRKGSPDVEGRCIVYWMRRSLRAEDNPALEIAIAAGNYLEKPVLVLFSLVPVSNANLRHYTFMVEAFNEIDEQLLRKNVRFILRREPDDNVAGFCAETRAALLVTDENPLRGPERRLRRVMERLRIPVWSVDADVVVPTKLIPGKQYAARIIRPKLARLRDEFLVEPKSGIARVSWRGTLRTLSPDETSIQGLAIDRSVQPSQFVRGGSNHAGRALRDFVRDRLHDYPKWRNHPEENGTSHLSPYLHFGQISPVRIALEVSKADAASVAKEAFLDQLITWRELSINFVRNNKTYDSIECAEPWSARTLAKHSKDKRPVVYNERQLENAETYDDLWNAAQIQMVEHGWMHNYMRMYWGKKILEWTRSPAEGFQIAVRLNDKYEIDGRDPNGYAGIAWAIAGKLDRPWFERPIFGQIRYMSAASTGKKFDSKKYVEQNRR